MISQLCKHVHHAASHNHSTDRHSVPVCTGIEHDVKIWSPLAEKAQPPGREAEELMSRNRNQAAVLMSEATLGPPMMLSLPELMQGMRALRRHRATVSRYT